MDGLRQRERRLIAKLRIYSRLLLSAAKIISRWAKFRHDYVKFVPLYRMAFQAQRLLQRDNMDVSRCDFGC